MRQCLSDGVSACENRRHEAQTIIPLYTLFLSLSLVLVSPLAAFVTSEGDFWRHVVIILTSPAQLVTDYFALGGLGSAFFNAGVCGLFANAVIALSRVHANASTFAAYLLVIAHGFYGLNFFNMWPPILGILLYCLIRKQKFSDNVPLALFSTALGPFISDFCFRYPLTHGEGLHLTFYGVLLSLLFGLATGFVLPALLPGTTAMHRGYNLFKAGLAIGILGIFIYAFLYKTLGIPAPTVEHIYNPAYDALPYKYMGFVNGFLLALFGATLLVGVLLNGRSFRGFGSLLRDSGYGTDFLDNFGMPVCLINFAVYGACFLVFLNLVTLLPTLFPSLPQGAGFTGATLGVVFAALTFSADGQQIRTVAPIAVGYTLLFLLVVALCALFEIDVPWTLGSQSYINGLAFATGLCPFAGQYGFKVGVLAGFLSAVICTSTSAMHGGFVLYNGGFTAGLTALVLLPILDFYHVKPKHE